MDNVPSFLDRIDAVSALPGVSRHHAAGSLYNELVETDGVDALTWRALGIELGACAQAYPDGFSAHEFLRSRAADCHQRADLLGQVAARTRQLIPVVRGEVLP